MRSGGTRAPAGEASGPKPKQSKNIGVCDRDETTSPRLTNGLFRDLVASDGDSIPIHGAFHAALKVWELDVDIGCEVG
jgi:hypothetical protein